MSVFRSAAGERAVKDRYREILAAWPQDHEQLHIDTRHGQTFVVACGDPAQPALLLLHGSGSNAVSWFGDLPELAKSFRVYAVDMIGEPGLSDPNRLPWADPGYIEWLDDLFDALGVRTAGLIGMSLGGWLALTYACARPERVTHLVLIAPGGLAPARKTFMFKALGYMMLGSWGRARLEKLVGWDNGMHGADEDEAAQANTAAMMAFIQLINENFIFHREALPLLDQARLSVLRMPMLMFFGAKDALLNAPASCARLAAAVPQADIRLLPEAGHVILRKTADIVGFLLKP